MSVVPARGEQTLRERLRGWFSVVAVLLVLVVALAAVAYTQQVRRQEIVTQDLFDAITDTDTAYIALIDAEVPVFVLLPRDRWYDRASSNLEEAKAREGRAIAIATDGDDGAHRIAPDVVEIPATHEMLSPFLSVLPLQLYAYYVADLKGTDVDQPRNLAKTVTVE